MAAVKNLTHENPQGRPAGARGLLFTAVGTKGGINQQDPVAPTLQQPGARNSYYPAPHHDDAAGGGRLTSVRAAGTHTCFRACWTLSGNIWE